MPLFHIMVLQESPGHGVGVLALGNAFAILIGGKVHHMNFEAFHIRLFGSHEVFGGRRTN